MIFLNGPSQASFSFIVGLSIFTRNACEKMSCPSSIRCWDSNPRPLNHESSPITTRPGLPPWAWTFSMPLNHHKNVFLLWWIRLQTFFSKWCLQSHSDDKIVYITTLELHWLENYPYYDSRVVICDRREFYKIFHCCCQYCQKQLCQKQSSKLKQIPHIFWSGDPFQARPIS